MGRLSVIHIAEPVSKIKLANLNQEHVVITQDLVESADIQVKDWEGPFQMNVSLIDQSVRFDFVCLSGGGSCLVDIPIHNIKKTVKDYGMMVEAYESARSNLTPDRLEAIDMGRRALHNEGSEIVSSLLNPHVIVDDETARRMFTLISLLFLGHNVS